MLSSSNKKSDGYMQLECKGEIQISKTKLGKIFTTWTRGMAYGRTVAKRKNKATSQKTSPERGPETVGLRQPGLGLSQAVPLSAELWSNADHPSQSEEEAGDTVI